MKHIFIILLAALTLIVYGKENNLQKASAFSVVGKSRYSNWLNRNFIYGNKIKFDSYTFSLPEKADEMHCTPFQTDLNADGKMDYILLVSNTGNGKNFDSCSIYIFVNCPENAREGLSSGQLQKGNNGEKFRYFYLESYGISAAKTNQKILLKGTTLSGDCRTHIEHFYSFDKDGWMQEVAVRLKI